VRFGQDAYGLSLKQAIISFHYVEIYTTDRYLCVRANKMKLNIPVIPMLDLQYL
jgi:hypothetical protein